MINNRLRGYVLCILNPKEQIPFDNVVSGMIIVSKEDVPLKKKKMEWQAKIWGETFKVGLPIGLTFVNFDCIVDRHDKFELLNRFAKCKIIKVDEKLVSFITDNIKQISQVASSSFKKGIENEFKGQLRNSDRRSIKK